MMTLYPNKNSLKGDLALNQQTSYKALLFDLDDTLVDFKASEASALELVYKYFYKSFTEKETFTTNFHNINKELWESVEKMHLPIAQVSLKRFQLLTTLLSANVDPNLSAAFYEDKLGSVSWLPGAQEAVSTLKNEYKLGIITNGFSRIQRIKQQSLSLEKWFKPFVISEEVAISKPRKEVFDIALQEIGEICSDTIMIGDSLTSDYQGALNAGMDFCWINSGMSPLPDHLPQPKFILTSVAELPQVLNIGS
jgi:YjjG family noncanonical pyrimidine nucleotidase